MCGILGGYHLQQQPLDVESSTVEAMRDRMTSRGPDGAGLWREKHVVLAHRRLAIRDLQHGAQPWRSADGQVSLTYNGELYHTTQLKQELQQRGFVQQTECDTELLMQAYQAWGVDALQKLEGMYAFGLYDQSRNRLLLARDPFGIKPLYYTQLGNEFWFASTVDALLRHPKASREPDLAVLNHYLATLRMTLGNRTAYNGIHQLLPGQMLLIQNGEVLHRTFWEYPEQQVEIHPQDLVDEFEQQLSQSTQDHTISDVPVGMFLSSGLDSQSMAHLLEQTVPPMASRCVTGELNTAEQASLEFESSTASQIDETSIASQTAQKLNWSHDNVRVGSGEYLDRWIQLVRQTQLPATTPSDVLIESMAEQIAPQASVVLSGEGADELLYGYGVQHWSGVDFETLQSIQRGADQFSLPSRRKQFLNSYLSSYGRCDMNSLTDQYFQLNSLVPQAVRQMLWATENESHEHWEHQLWREYAQVLDEGQGRAVDRMGRLLHRMNLGMLLERLDRTTMQHSIEARVPFVHKTLVDFVFQVPFEQRISPYDPNGFSVSAIEAQQHNLLQTKKPLRQLAGKYLPTPQIHQPKQSFPTPVSIWMKTTWRQWSREKLQESPFLNSIFRRQPLQELAGNIAAGGMWLWPLMNLAIWGEQFS